MSVPENYNHTKMWLMDPNKDKTESVLFLREVIDLNDIYAFIACFEAIVKRHIRDYDIIDILAILDQLRREIDLKK
jgi:hypothetical protein